MRFAHGENDLRVTAGIYKTQMCNFYERGHCKKAGPTIIFVLVHIDSDFFGDMRMGQWGRVIVRVI